MKPAIAGKLQRTLRRPIRSEQQVVYILVELRKLLELEQRKKEFPALTFHCDWVGHPALERELAEDIVRAFNKEEKQKARREALKLQEAMAVENEHWALLGPTITLSNFRNQLSEYLYIQGIDNSVAQNGGKWARFLHYYGEIIKDCPLRCVGPKLKYVDEVSVQVDKLRPETTAKMGFTIRVKWVWTNKVDKQEWYQQQFF